MIKRLHWHAYSYTICMIIKHLYFQCWLVKFWFWNLYIKRPSGHLNLMMISEITYIHIKFSCYSVPGEPYIQKLSYHCWLIEKVCMCYVNVQVPIFVLWIMHSITGTRSGLVMWVISIFHPSLFIWWMSQHT